MSVSISNSKSAGVGGLCHLMEAATALSQLVEASSPPAADAAFAPAVGQRSVISDDDESCKKNKACDVNKRGIFPQRLMSILSDTSLTDIVTWLPNGKSFVIVRPDVFTETVLPKYLPPVDARGSTKYPSFTRKLNRWGFRQVTRGPDTGAFHHPLFRRDEPQLCLQMVCQRSRDRRSSGANKQGGKSSLPPKKRAFVSGQDLPVLQQRQTLNLAPASVSAVSLGGHSSSSTLSSSSSSISSNGPSVGSSFLQVPTKPSSAACGPATAAVNKAVANLAVAPKPALIGYVSKDAVLIQEALRQSQEQERLRAAKAMLYHAYMQALGAASQQQTGR